MGRVKKNRKKRCRVVKPARFAGFIIVVILLSALIVFGIKGAVKKFSGGAKDGNLHQNQSEISDNEGGAIGGNEASNPPEEPLDEEPLENNGGSDITRKLIEEAHAAQDYFHAPGEDAKPIATVDDNILILVNKTHPLGKEYAPQDLVTIERNVQGVGTKDTKKMRKIAADALNKLFDGAAKEGHTIKLRTAYRSYEYQEVLYAGYAERNGEEKASRFSARAGESEHQTGLCADVSSPSVGYEISYKYKSTPEGKWLSEHAHEYGYIIRFPEGKEDITGYTYEPWHIRYVGPEAAGEIYEKNVTLEEYLGVTEK